MQARRVSDVRDLISSESFRDWYAQYREVRDDIGKARQRESELLAQVDMLRFKVEGMQSVVDDTFFRAGACEDLSAGAHAEFAEVENVSFEALSAYEAQRLRAMEALAHLHRLENTLEDLRQRSSEARGLLDASRRQTRTPDALGREEAIEAELRGLDSQIRPLAADIEQAREQLMREEALRDTLWVEVEDAWTRSFRANMARTEFAYQARRVRGEAELLFKRVVRDRQRAVELSAEAQRIANRLEGLQADLERQIHFAREHFGCVLVEEFLYWPRAEDVKAALCVPLIDESNHLNISVQALGVYNLDRAKGLDFIEPIYDPAELGKAEEDPRLDAFFASERAIA